MSFILLIVFYKIDRKITHAGGTRNNALAWFKKKKKKYCESVNILDFRTRTLGAYQHRTAKMSHARAQHPPTPAVFTDRTAHAKRPSHVLRGEGTRLHLGLF